MSWLKSMVASNSESVSSKRVITLLAFLMCSMAFTADLFYGLKVSKESFDAMMYIVIAGLGFTASERFSSKQPKQGDEK
jgi:hypothetical protein